jgi:hypothetical protein
VFISRPASPNTFTATLTSPSTQLTTAPNCAQQPHVQQQPKPSFPWAVRSVLISFPLFYAHVLMQECPVMPREQLVEISDQTAQLVLGEGNMEEWNDARFMLTLDIMYWYVYFAVSSESELNKF